MSKQTLEQLFEGVEGASPALVQQLQPIFEARIDEAVKVKLDEIEASHKEAIDEMQHKLDEAVSFNINESNLEMAKKLDHFLESAIVDWANSNSVALQESAVVTAADTFFEHLTEAASKLNTRLPEGEEADKIAELTQKNESYKARLNDSMQQVFSLNESIIEQKRERIIEEVSQGMTDFGKITLSEKCSGSNFVSETQFKRLVEGYKHIVETEDENEEEDEGGLKESNAKLPQNAKELDKQTKKDAKPVLESSNFGNIDMSLFLGGN